MKIISGSKKSHVIRAPKNLSIVRPTSGLVKESLFNILSNYFIFNEIKVLDLYAGIGNISYDIGGAKEVISDGKNGFIVEPGDVDSLKEKVKMLLENNEMLLSLSKGAAETNLTNFSSDVMVDKLEELYRKIH